MPESASESPRPCPTPTIAPLARDLSTQQIIACAIEVHRALGPGLLESAYVRCLAHEFRLNRISFRAELPVPVLYKGIAMKNTYRVDFLVEGAVVVEVKSVDRMNTAHGAQLLTYMKFLRAPVGLLINFNVARLVQGVQRFRR
jgi:GxxExxY protein